MIFVPGTEYETLARIDRVTSYILYMSYRWLIKLKVQLITKDRKSLKFIIEIEDLHPSNLKVNFHMSVSFLK